jgi:hypothetical protein
MPHSAAVQIAEGICTNPQGAQELPLADAAGSYTHQYRTQHAGVFRFLKSSLQPTGDSTLGRAPAFVIAFVPAHPITQRKEFASLGRTNARGTLLTASQRASRRLVAQPLAIVEVCVVEESGHITPGRRSRLRRWQWCWGWLGCRWRGCRVKTV